MRVSLDASRMPVVMPRVGVQLNLLSDLNNVLYKGNGPHECYPDRKASSIHALHRARVEDMYTPYLHPTESSARTDVHWCTLTQAAAITSSSTSPGGVQPGGSSNYMSIETGCDVDTSPKKTIGLLVYSGCIADNRDHTNVLSTSSTVVAASASSSSLPRSHYTTKTSINSDYDSIVQAPRDESAEEKEQSALFNFSAQRHTTEDLALATHTSELELAPRQFVALNVDPFLMGVGGDDGWSASVHEEHLLNPGIYMFDVNLSIYYT
jgi:hypothetical protein